MIRQTKSEVVDWFFKKIVLIFPMNFLNFRSDTIEKQGILNLGSHDS